MTWLLTVAACLCPCRLAAATGLSVTLANGQTLVVIESSTPVRTGYSFERRYPDGTRDRQFGPRGRVSIDVGGSGFVPLTVGSDALGHILLAGVASFPDRSRGAVVARYLPTGQVDSPWGENGQVRLPVALGGSQAADVLARPDGSLLVVGRVEDAGLQQSSIWRVSASGKADPQFGQHGAMLAEALPLSQVLSIQQAPDGALQLAVQTARDGKSWIEMHRWQSGDPFPLRVARQELPDQWIGPASLVFRIGQWLWLDASQPERFVAVVVQKQPDSPWTQKDPLPEAAAESMVSTAHTPLNPDAATGVGAREAPADSSATTFWFLTSAAGILVIGATIWRSLRN